MTCAIFESVAGPSKRSGGSLRSKANPTPKRPPPSSHASGSIPGDLSRRAGGGAAVATSAENSRAYRNSHAYAVSQQPMFTSWNLPDYLAHLEHMLPTDTPRPLEVRGSGIANGRELGEWTMERGVKVKWPSKRTSVGDMNKRVRALVEWVGREQAGALDRVRRRDALEKALKAVKMQASNPTTSSHHDDREVGGGDSMCSPVVLDTITAIAVDGPLHGDAGAGNPSAPSTMKMMEELMEELISFQERFGPGVKTRDRERRIVS